MGLLADAETTVGLTGVRSGAATGSGDDNGTALLTGLLTGPGSGDTVPDVRTDAAVAGARGEADGADAGRTRTVGASVAALAWGQGKPAIR